MKALFAPLVSGRQACAPGMENSLLALILILSLGCAAVGIRQKLRFDYTPGAQGIMPATWPAHSSIRRAANAPTLLVFSHPLCSCTKSTLGELARVLAESPVHPAVEILFFASSGNSSKEIPDLWKKASALPYAKVSWDEGGREAARFGARTSGTIYVFGPDGQRIFQGGITASRGHEGDNRGEQALLSALATERPQQHLFRVFGCGLFADALFRGTQ